MQPDVSKSASLAKLIWPLLAPSKGRVVAAAVAMVLSSAMLLGLGWGLKCVIDRGFGDQSGGMLDQALIGMFALVLAMAFAAYMRQLLANSLAEQAIATLRSRIFNHLLKQDGAYFDQHATGDLMTRINADTTVLQILMTGQLPTLLRHSLMLLGGVTMLCVVSPLMTVILLLAVPFVIGPVIYFGRRVRAKSRSTQESLGQLTSFGMEQLQGIRTVQAFLHESFSSDGFSSLVEETKNRAVQQIKSRALMTAIVIFIAFSAVGVVLWSGGQKVLNGNMTAGDLSAFIFYAATVAGSLMNLSEVGGEFNRAAGAADRLSAILDVSPQLKGIGNAWSENPSGYAGAITFNDVSFHYPSRKVNALSHLSLSIAAGKTTAIVGASGAGKSTIFQLLQRFYDVNDGSIMIDGVDISNVDPIHVRDMISVVSQDPFLFSASVMDNIRMAKPEASNAEVEAAARLAQAHDFIMALPEGYATRVGERGSRLSGGQKQRIAIARAFLKDSKILLLDEATSALDTQNEQALYAALSSLTAGRTTLIIAHKLSTIHAADQILVLDHGKLQASGTHDSLSRSNEIYRNLSFSKIA